MSCASAIIPGTCSSLSRTTVNRVFQGPMAFWLVDWGLPASVVVSNFPWSSPGTFVKFAPVGETRTRFSGGYKRTTAGVVMKVSRRASRTNIENTRWERIPAESPTLSTMSSTSLRTPSVCAACIRKVARLTLYSSLTIRSWLPHAS